MSPEEKQANALGPGGYKCICCGPTPKQRPKWRRLIRRRLAAWTRKHVHNELKEKNITPPSPRNWDGYDDSHEISAAMGHQGGMAVRQNRGDPYR